MANYYIIIIINGGPGNTSLQHSIDIVVDLIEVK